MSPRSKGPLPASLLNSPPRASVVIANWNGAALLRACLISLQQQTYRDFEVIVVDNGSRDESVAMVANEFPTVRLLALSTNGGFSAGSNAGIRIARGEILVMLNNDIEAEPAWLGELVAALDRHPEAGSAASRMMLYDRRDRLHSAGDFVRADGTADSRGVWTVYGPPYDLETMVFGPCGGAAAYRRAMLDQIGLFEERFFMYCEDIDLNWRAQLAGWPCVYAPRAVVYHHLSATGGGVLSSFYVGRNALWVLARCLPGLLWRRHWRHILAAQLRIAGDALRAWRGPAARARLRGQLAGLLTWPRWWGARRCIQRQCRLSPGEIMSLLELE